MNWDLTQAGASQNHDYRKRSLGIFEEPKSDDECGGDLEVLDFLAPEGEPEEADTKDNVRQKGRERRQKQKRESFDLALEVATSKRKRDVVSRSRKSDRDRVRANASKGRRLTPKKQKQQSSKKDSEDEFWDLLDSEDNDLGVTDVDGKRMGNPGLEEETSTSSIKSKGDRRNETQKLEQKLASTDKERAAVEASFYKRGKGSNRKAVNHPSRTTPPASLEEIRQARKRESLSRLLDDDESSLSSGTSRSSGGKSNSRKETGLGIENSFGDISPDDEQKLTPAEMKRRRISEALDTSESEEGEEDLGEPSAKVHVNLRKKRRQQGTPSQKLSRSEDTTSTEADDSHSHSDSDSDSDSDLDCNTPSKHSKQSRRYSLRSKSRSQDVFLGNAAGKEVGRGKRKRLRRKGEFFLGSQRQLVRDVPPLPGKSSREAAKLAQLLQAKQDSAVRKERLYQKHEAETEYSDSDSDKHGFQGFYDNSQPLEVDSESDGALSDSSAERLRCVQDDNKFYSFYCACYANGRPIKADQGAVIGCSNILCRNWEHEGCNKGHLETNSPQYFCSLCRKLDYYEETVKKYKTTQDYWENNKQERKDLINKIWNALLREKFKELKKLFIGHKLQKKDVNELVVRKRNGKGLLQAAASLGGPEGQLIFDFLLNMPFIAQSNLKWFKDKGYAETFKAALEIENLDRCNALIDWANTFGKPPGQNKLPKELDLTSVYGDLCFHCIRKSKSGLDLVSVSVFLFLFFLVLISVTRY